jgi:serine/threonine-protein kinase
MGQSPPSHLFTSPALTDALEQLRASLAGRYQLERELGRGGMATVYLARDLKHERLVVLKLLTPESAATLGRRTPARGRAARVDPAIALSAE